MIRSDFIQQYWRYYLTLEDDFLRTTRFVEIDTINFSAYSVEYAKQYQSICSELDVILKVLCNLLDSLKNPSKIPGYAQIILSNYPEIKEAEVKIKNNSSSITIFPWNEWTLQPEYTSPKWWSYYNKVKHGRTTLDNSGLAYFKKANLENVLNALSALFVVEMYL